MGGRGGAVVGGAVVGGAVVGGAGGGAGGAITPSTPASCSPVHPPSTLAPWDHETLTTTRTTPRAASPSAAHHGAMAPAPPMSAPPAAACPLPTSTAIAQDDAPDAAATAAAAAAAYDARNPPPPPAAAAAAQDGALFAAEESSKLGSLGFPPFAHVAADGHLCAPTAQGSSAACAQASLGAAVNVNVNAQAYIGAAVNVSKAAAAAQIREGVHAQIREDVGVGPSDETRVTKGCGPGDETRAAVHAGALAGSCLCNLEHVSAAHEHARMALGWPDCLSDGLSDGLPPQVMMTSIDCD
jgi:hypothetical protein